jgi:hypothetical protein
VSIDCKNRGPLFTGAPGHRVKPFEWFQGDAKSTFRKTRNDNPNLNFEDISLGFLDKVMGMMGDDVQDHLIRQAIPTIQRSIVQEAQELKLASCALTTPARESADAPPVSATADWRTDPDFVPKWLGYLFEVCQKYWNLRRTKDLISMTAAAAEPPSKFLERFMNASALVELTAVTAGQQITTCHFGIDGAFANYSYDKLLVSTMQLYKGRIAAALDLAVTELETATDLEAQREVLGTYLASVIRCCSRCCTRLSPPPASLRASPPCCDFAPLHQP